MLQIKKLLEKLELTNTDKRIQPLTPPKDKINDCELWVRVTDNDESPTFFYKFFNTTFQIDNATHAHFFNRLDKEDGFTYQILLVMADSGLYILSFCSPHERKDILSTLNATHSIIAYINDTEISSTYGNRPKGCYNISTNHFKFKNGWYFLNWDPTNHLSCHPIASVIKFNHYYAITHPIPKGANITFEQKKICNVVTDKEIFDMETFRTYSLEKLFSEYSLDYKSLFFKIFTLPSRKKVLFVCNETVDFRSIKNAKSEYFGRGKYVQGFLYDLANQEIIHPNDTSKSVWSTFILYDDKLPHVFKNELECAKKEYGVIFFDEKHDKFSTLISSKKPILISYKNTEDENAPSHIVNTRFIFMELKNKKNHTFYKNDSEDTIGSENVMMALDENLNIVNIDSHLQLEAVNFFEQKITHPVDYQSNSLVFHLSNHDSLIIKSYKGEFGESVLVFLDEGTKINYNLSFFGFQRLVLPFDFTDVIHATYPNSNHLMLSCRKNDFENEVYVVNLLTHKNYTLDEFTALLASEF